MDLYSRLLNIRKIAIENHLSDDIETYIEKCYRHYSKTYSVSLDECRSKMAPEQVALVYMEDELSDWNIEEIMKIKEMLSTSDVPVLHSGMAEKEEDVISDDEWIAQQEALVKQQEEKKRKQQEEIAKKTHEAIEQLTKSFDSFSKAVDKEDKE